MIRELHPETKRKVRAALTSVLADPTIGVPLRDPLNGFRRLRIGRWRVVYRERARVIEVFAVGPRATVYSELVARLDRDRRRASSLPRPLDLRSKMTSEAAIDHLRDE